MNGWEEADCVLLNDWYWEECFGTRLTPLEATMIMGSRLYSMPFFRRWRQKNLNVHSNDPNTGTRAITRSLMDRSTRRQYSQCYLTNWFYITNHQWLTQHLLPLGRNQNWQKNEMVRWREWEKPTPNLWRRLHSFLLRPVQIVFNVIPHLPKLTNQ